MGDSPAAILHNTSGNEIATASNPARVDPTGTTTQPVSATSLPLPSGAATSALQTTGNTSVGNIDTKTPALGQAAMAASVPVVIASNQSAIPVTGSFSSSVIPNPDDTTGNISALNGAVSAAVEGWQSCGVVLTGTWAATLVVEESYDGGSTWITIGFIVPASAAASLPSIVGFVSTNGAYQVMGMGPMTNVRVRAAAYTSGTVAVRLVFSDTAPAMGYSLTQMLQNVIGSIRNSSAANLAAGAAFTGTAEGTLGVAGIQISYKADQPARIQIQQSPDGTNWDISDEMLVPAGSGRGRTIQAINSYFRVICTNIGNATTTYLRLQSCLCPVVEVLPRTLTEFGKLALASPKSDWIPSDHNFSDAGYPELGVDIMGNLMTRSQVLTDETSFRDDFATANPYVDLAGTVYFTNGSIYVTGVGTAFRSACKTQHYIKLSVHADTVYAPIADVLSDTLLKLGTAYTGATASGTGRLSFWLYSIGSGGSVAHASSEVGLASGTTSGTVVQAKREGDFLPYSIGFRARISQRIANQVAIFGLADDDTTPQNQALIVFDGTTNTTVKCRTSFASTDVEETTVTLPGGATTATAANWQVEVLPNKVVFYYNDVRLAEHKTHIPGTYAPMNCYAQIKNTGTAGSTTTLYADVYWLCNYDILQIGTLGKDAVTTREARASNSAVTSVAAAVADTILLVANSIRMGAAVTNDSVATLYLKLGTGASLTSHTAQIPRGGYYEVPFGYTGAINGYWSAATGSARVTEVTQ